MLCLAWLIALPIIAEEHYSIRHYSIEDGLSQNTITYIMQDKQGYIWLGTWCGLNRFDGYTFETFQNTDGERVTHRVNVIYEDSLEQIWWKTYDGHYYSLDKGRQNIRSANISEVPRGLLRLEEQKSETSRMDKDGVLWQVTDEIGISRYRDGNWKHFTPPLDSRYSGTLRKHFILLEDTQGRTWVNPTGGGFSYYDYEKDELVYPFTSICNMIHTAYVDREGLMWIATYDNGVDCVNMAEQPYSLHDRREEGSKGEVRAMIETKDGTLITYCKDARQIYCAHETKDGTLILGTKGHGLLHSNYTPAYPSIRLSSQDIYDIEEDENGTLYVATYGGGINIFNPQETTTNPLILAANSQVRDLQIVGRTLWAATTTGLLRINLVDHSILSIPCYDIRCIYYTTGRLWVGTFGGGLYYVDTQASKIELTHIETSMKIVMAMCGSEDFLLFSSELGITQLDINTLEYNYFDITDEYGNIYFTEAEALRTHTGEILFGYSNGYCSFDLSKASRSSYVPPIKITHCISNGTDYHSNSIHIPYGDAHLSIEYAALDYAGPNKIQYAYVLQGLDKHWTIAHNQRNVNYTHLKPGDYTFRVRSTNRDGVWMDNEEFILIHIDRPFWSSWWAIALYTLVFVLIFALIIYIFHTQTALREEMKIEQKVTEIKLRFFTNISHELRTPLTLITGPVDNILQNERLSPSVRSQLEIVQNNGQRMLRLVNQLLDFRKIQNNKMRLKIQRTIMVGLVEDVCANFNKEAFDKHIHLMIENKATDTLVWVDRQRMDTILYNLLSNAFKFTPSGKSIRVILDEKPGFLLLSVSDEGIGIPKDRRSLLFERFASDDLLNKDKPGTGIGLNLVKELVDLHKGFIEVHSTEGHGTTFTIMLHRGTEHYDHDADIVITDDSQPTKIYGKTLDDKLQKVSKQNEIRHILVVDDNKDMRQFLKTILRSDYEVSTASDGIQALAAIQVTQPDLIISDLMMPNMDGLELIDTIKHMSENCHIPIILLTAKSAIESRLEALDYGADDYITKPFETEYIKARVRNILLQRQQLENAYRSRLLRMEPQRVNEQETNDAFLARLMEFMEQQMDNSELTVDNMVEHMGVGRTVFFNRLKKQTGLSPVEFIREVRIKRAAQLLEKGEYNISEVTYMVGMNDSRYFSKCFKSTFNMTPSEYRKAKLGNDKS